MCEVRDESVDKMSVSGHDMYCPWSGRHGFEARLGQTWGAWYFCELFLNQNLYSAQYDVKMAHGSELHVEYIISWYIQ